MSAPAFRRGRARREEARIPRRGDPKATPPIYSPGLIREIMAGRGHQVVANAEAVRVIQVNVAERFGVRLADMFSLSRGDRVSRARKIAMYLCDELVSVSRFDLAALFNRADSHSVINACNWVDRRAKALPVFATLLEDFRERLRPLVCGERLSDVG